MPGTVSHDPRVSLVMVTRDRCELTLETLDRLHGDHPAHRVVVVDNDSRDGTAYAVGVSHPEVSVLALADNLGGGGRSVGSRHVNTPYVAFCDDDSWWERGALDRAADVLDRHPRLAVLAARVLVGPENRLDPTCDAMAHSPLPHEEDMPGPPVLGFLACGAVVRRDAFLDVGGFDARFGVGGEEELTAIDLARAGWGLAYVDSVVAHHHPSAVRNRSARQRRQARNALWTAWLRRPLGAAVRRTSVELRQAQGRATALGALRDAVGGLPWVVRERRAVSAELERRLRRLESA
jgi:GT2 family glycosyltransferase